MAGIEARGFILAAPAAIQLGAGFVPVRKQGKLPGPTYAQSYELEYGSATIEVHQDAFAPGERVLIVDDVLATGGTGAATAELVRKAGAEVTGIAVILELELPARAAPAARCPHPAHCWLCDEALTSALSGSSADRIETWRT